MEKKKINRKIYIAKAIASYGIVQEQISDLVEKARKLIPEEIQAKIDAYQVQIDDLAKDADLLRKEVRGKIKSGEEIDGDHWYAKAIPERTLDPEKVRKEVKDKVFMTVVEVPLSKAQKILLPAQIEKCLDTEKQSFKLEIKPKAGRAKKE